ncbi:energy-coupling factor transporter ATPase [Acetobacterium fimetarium]|uniref:Energy-coupling factor transporter ATPase n=1 Tax=Acetobacterium fimetarium TaxID=52691 RepID=A0ABR6WT15_9FIRM|nr:energy-coupling factor transporter ATPase [Acetobacterium fimetarium]MBC3803763.1 energy-coupling factor transporter ATPase [Acetobacterium fimetarium]
MEKKEKMIEVKDVCFVYPGNSENKSVTALSDINLHINKGEFVGIIGHNGSGKSTLSKLLNAIIFPTAGDVIINGLNPKDHEHLWDIRQTAGMVFQNPDNQLVATIVEEDVAFGPENLGVPSLEIRERVDRALATVDMQAYAHQKPHQLSGGQKQRIAIAGILAMEPECIIFDEPTAMLDPSGRREVMETIRKLNQEKNMTIIHITHYMSEIINADRIIVLDAGKIVMEGTPVEIFKNVSALKKIGLDVPQMTELAYELRKEGMNIKDSILSIDEMVDALCQ